MVLLASKQGLTLLAEEDTPNDIVIYNVWHKHRLIVVNPNRPRHFRLDAINKKQLFALKGV